MDQPVLSTSQTTTTIFLLDRSHIFDNLMLKFYYVCVLIFIGGGDIMTLAKWEPLRDLLTLQDRMNRLFDDSVRGLRPGEEGLASGIWSPPVDIYETDNEVILKAELPEVNQKDIDIQIENNT